MKYTKEQLQNCVNQSETISDVVRLLTNKKGRLGGGQVDHIKNRLISEGIDFDHFLGQAHGRGGGHNKHTKETFALTYLRTGSNIITNRLKHFLWKFGFKKRQCENCNLKEEWYDLFLTLQIDHINGIRNDNRLENLRILCPNCHSQTKTYSGKNKLSSPR